MKFNTVSLAQSEIFNFTSLKPFTFQLKADYQSHAIILIHPDTIINKKIFVNLR